MKLIKESYLKIKKNLSETVLAGKYRFCIVPSPTHLSPRKKIYSSFLQKVWLYSGFSPTPYPTLSFTACYFELYSTNLQLATWYGNKQFLVNRKCNSRSLKMYQHFRTVYTYNLNNNVNILTDVAVFCFFLKMPLISLKSWYIPPSSEIEYFPLFCLLWIKRLQIRDIYSMHAHHKW